MHPLPYPLSAMDKVSTDADAEFVIFPSNTSGEAVGGSITFRKEGFKEFPNVLVRDDHFLNFFS